MQRIINWRIGTILLACFLFCLIYGTVKHNLAAATAAISAQEATIVIDAGHGGEDGGAIGIGGSSESQLNLSIALRLEQLLQFCGFETYMTRTTDHSVHTEGDSVAERKVSDLKNRVAMVASNEPAILVSIHQNHFSEEQYYGAQVFYSPSSESKQLAELTQRFLCQFLDPDNNRVCKQASSVYLMDQIDCPGILIECGFLSNREEEVLLLQPDYQKKIVCAISGALINFTSEGDNDFEV